MEQKCRSCTAVTRNGWHLTAERHDFAKKNKLPTQTVYDNADELKVIIYNKHDFIFAEEQAEKVNENAILFLQPEWSKKEEMTPLIVEYVMKNPRWRVSLQTHKYLNIP